MNSFEYLSTSSIDSLFEKYPISHIGSIRKDLELEISKKRDEIRILVGEKYRNFVDVSNNIHSMNEVARNTFHEIYCLSSSLDTLSSIGNEIEPEETNDNLGSDETQHRLTVATLSKLLIDVGNQLWLEIENQKYVAATILLQFAVRIKTVLKLENTKKTKIDIPFVSFLWDSVLRFSFILTKSIENEFQSVELTITTACECFCSLSLLQNQCIVNIIEEFLKLRLKTLELILSQENIIQKVGSRIRQSFLAIIKTLEILYCCFHQSNIKEYGEYWKLLTIASNFDHGNVLNLINQDEITRRGNAYLPPDVKNFKVKLHDSTPSSLDIPAVSKIIQNWMQEVEEKITDHLPNYLNLINSLQSLNSSKQIIPIDQNDWLVILNYFDQKHNINLWNRLYEPLIIERSKILLTQRWNTLFTRVRHKMEIFLQEIENTNKRELESDLSGYLWRFMDCTDSQKSSQQIGSSGENLQMKASGLSSSTGRMCAFIETLLLDLMDELSDICSSKDVESWKVIILKDYQQTCCISFTEKFTCSIREFIEIEGISEEKLLFFARLLSGIPLFCPALKQCVLLGDEKAEKWLSINTKIYEESLNIWRKWSSLVIHSMSIECELFSWDVSPVTFNLKYFTKWNAIKLNEVDDRTSNHDLELHIPMFASFILQNTLNELATLIACILPPKIIVTEMMSDIAVKILDCMEKVAKKIVSYNLRLQFLFDVKYLSIALIPMENEELCERSHQLLKDLESKVDPVDLDLISSNLSSNVRQFLFNTQGIFGPLMNQNPHVIFEQYTDSSEDPYVIHVAADNIPSFSLFPTPKLHTVSVLQEFPECDQ